MFITFIKNGDLTLKKVLYKQFININHNIWILLEILNEFG